MNTLERNEQTLLMVREYEAGDSLSQVGRRHGITGNAVRYRLRMYGVAMRPKGGRPQGVQDTSKMASEYEGGDTLTAIGARHGMTPAGVKARLVKHGVALRSKAGMV